MKKTYEEQPPPRLLSVESNGYAAQGTQQGIRVAYDPAAPGNRMTHAVIIKDTRGNTARYNMQYLSMRELVQDLAEMVGLRTVSGVHDIVVDTDKLGKELGLALSATLTRNWSGTAINELVSAIKDAIHRAEVTR